MVDFLVVVPHPDDEVFGAGGTLIELSERGLRTGLITLTRGEAGRTLGLCPPERLAQIRTEELQRSAAILGVSYLEILDFPNAKPEHDDLGPLPRGTDRGEGVADHPEIADLLRQRFHELRPRIVVTFPPNGINQHPDHVAASRWVAKALEHGPEVQLLYYTSPQPLPGQEAEHLPPTHLRQLQPSTVLKKLRAMAQHRTQALSVLAFLDRAPERIGVETFHQVGYQGPLQSDLLVDLD
jgi:LmbE family N-acetylglucosaminyl deacetylase